MLGAGLPLSQASRLSAPSWYGIAAPSGTPSALTLPPSGPRPPQPVTRCPGSWSLTCHRGEGRGGERRDALQIGCSMLRKGRAAGRPAQALQPHSESRGWRSTRLQGDQQEGAEAHPEIPREGAQSQGPVCLHPILTPLHTIELFLESPPSSGGFFRSQAAHGSEVSSGDWIYWETELGPQLCPFSL